MRNNHWMQTYTGKQFWPLDPRVEDIDIRDIAHHLSLQCRFAGACKHHYSVAQHSVLVSLTCSVPDAKWGLLHDAAEAYLQDMVRPLKQDEDFAHEYRIAEARLMRVICDRFGLAMKQPESVTEADTAVLLAEKRDIMAPAPAEWNEEQVSQINVIAYPRKIEKWTPEEAEESFLHRFGNV